jgi:hypothetical protein
MYCRAAATQIITMSEYSRHGIIKTHGIAGDRITVTPEAASDFRSAY